MSRAQQIEREIIDVQRAMQGIENLMEHNPSMARLADGHAVLSKRLGDLESALQSERLAAGGEVMIDREERIRLLEAVYETSIIYRDAERAAQVTTTVTELLPAVEALRVAYVAWVAALAALEAASA